MIGSKVSIITQVLLYYSITYIGKSSKVLNNHKANNIVCQQFVLDTFEVVVLEAV